jgi:hypothetical protein
MNALLEGSFSGIENSPCPGFFLLRSNSSLLMVRRLWMHFWIVRFCSAVQGFSQCWQNGAHTVLPSHLPIGTIVTNLPHFGQVSGRVFLLAEGGVQKVSVGMEYLLYCFPEGVAKLASVVSPVY